MVVVAVVVAVVVVTWIQLAHKIYLIVTCIQANLFRKYHRNFHNFFGINLIKDKEAIITKYAILHHVSKYIITGSYYHLQATNLTYITTKHVKNKNITRQPNTGITNLATEYTGFQTIFEVQHQPQELLTSSCWCRSLQNSHHQPCIPCHTLLYHY